MNATPHDPRRTGDNRRGVLLLVVLSMLTLFLLLGTAYLVASTRSRETARAYNRLVMQSDTARIPHAKLLDAAFLRAVRGGTAPTPPPSMALTGTDFLFESLLEDKYGRGTTITGTATSSTSSPPLITAEVTTTSSTAAIFLPGRVLTFVPDGGDATSHRILAASGTAPGTLTLVLDMPPRASSVQGPLMPCRVLVNGREFDGQSLVSGTTTVINEAWDGFDQVNNPFLAQVEPVASGSAIATSNVVKPSYLAGTSLLTKVTNGIPEGADNDGDGKPDGLFLDFGFPTITLGGNNVELRASVLIVDLDSRFNVNAHGSLARSLYLTSPAHSGWPTPANLTPTGTNFTNAPLGSGYGPAEVNADVMFPQTGPNTYATQRLQSGENPQLSMMTGLAGTSSGQRPSGSRFTPSTLTPRLQPMQGRYGGSNGWPTIASGNTTLPTSPASFPLPGQAGVNDLISKVNDTRTPPAVTANGCQVDDAAAQGIPSLWWNGAANFNWAAAGSGGGLPRATFNSPPDLHGRMKTITVSATGQGVAPRLLFAKPEWGPGETTDDPYELRLDRRAARNGWLDDPAVSGTTPVYDNVFMASELEAVLRPYDIDSTKLPMRLAALLGSVAEEARLRVTTDSWDTTMITGTAASTLATWLALPPHSFGTSPLLGTLGGEVARGERFDLNRPLTSAKPAAYNPWHPYYVQRQAYFKDLYTLTVALLHPTGMATPAQAQAYAQWAANVVEFSDADSTMTPFEYDQNPSNGWDVDSDARTSGQPDRAVVWGAERPEMLIAATSAWEDDTTGELFIMLHRPWNALAFSSGTSTPAEPIDPALDTSPAPSNVVDLGNKSGQGTAPATYPVWRLRIVDASGTSTIVRLDATTGTSSPSGELSSSAVTNAATSPKLAVDSWLCIKGSNTIGASITASGTVTIDRGGHFRVPGTLPSVAGTPPRPATVYLERLSDPSIEVSPSVNQAVWTTGTASAATSGTTVPMYRVVDQAPIGVVNRVKDPIINQVPATGIATTLNRNANGNVTLWKSLPLGSQAGAMPAASVTAAPTIAPFGPGTPPVAWFNWPNRPFVSPAELLLVPADDALTMLTNYAKPSATSPRIPTPLLLDAVHVPTRFAGVHQTVTLPAATSSTGVLPTKAGIFAEITPVNQLSAFREPGRVNLNTVTSDDVWNAVVAGPLTQTGTTTPDPLRSRATASFSTSPAKTMVELLALSGTGTSAATDTNSALTSGTAFNPAHTIYTATRLANTATIRSNVFAVWITLRESVAGDPDSVKYHRGFYIFDRSIPVAHEAGKDHNIWDAVLLRRIIE